MKIGLALIALLFSSFTAQAANQPTLHLKTLNASIAKSAVASYTEGHYRYLQDGKLIEMEQVDTSRPSCILETYKMNFDPTVSYAITSIESNDIDGEAGELVLIMDAQSADPDASFMMYCFQEQPGATIDTAKAGLSSVFEIE